MSYEVELKHIEKYFGSFKAADDASFGVEKGQLAGSWGLPAVARPRSCGCWRG